MAVSATLVRWFPNDDPDDLRGMALVPTKCTQDLDLNELDERLRDITPEISKDPKDERAYAVETRNQLITLGGRPTRPVGTFDESHTNPETVELYGVEFALWERYSNESSYWNYELYNWQKFLRYRERKAKRSNTYNETTAAQATDQAILFTEYLAYQQEKITSFDSRERPGLKWERQDLVNRLDSIKQQLLEIQSEIEHKRKQRNDDDDQQSLSSVAKLGSHTHDGCRRSLRIAAKAGVQSVQNTSRSSKMYTRPKTRSGSGSRGGGQRSSIKQTKGKPQGITKVRKIKK